MVGLIFAMFCKTSRSLHFSFTSCSSSVILTTTMASTSQKTDTTRVTTTISKVEEGDDVEMKDESTDQRLPAWLEEAKGLVYLEEVDGFIDPDAIKIEPPKCVIDDKVVSVYQCIKCGNKQSNREDIHRMKCTRCFNKAFNKIRPTKWVKFRAY